MEIIVFYTFNKNIIIIQVCTRCCICNYSATAINDMKVNINQNDNEYENY